MKKLFVYNKIVFILGTTFTKFWMISMPIFCGAAIYNLSTMEDSAVMILLFALFLLFYPFRNLIEIQRILRRYEERNGNNLEPGDKEVKEMVDKFLK